jgi:iron complex transport system substrate-binding protein
MSPPAQRIVSLLASGTELVCALGLGDKLVGRSHECDHPPWVARLPEVSRPTFDIDGSSHDIDQRVRERLRDGKPLYEVDEALLAKLEPDVLITQTHCEVCAVSPSDLAHHAPARLERRQVLALGGSTLREILGGFADVARVLGEPAAGLALVASLQARLDQLAERTRSLPRPSVVCLEWLAPLFAMSNWGPELVELAGGTSLLGIAGAHSTTTSWDAVREANPQVLVVAACGFGLERTLGEMSVLERQPGFRELRAVQSGNVFVADGNLYFNRSGPSLFETPELLAEMLHQEVFAPRHEGEVWRRWAQGRAEPSAPRSS